MMSEEDYVIIAKALRAHREEIKQADETMRFDGFF